jgi:LD-carboxypeptidase N-terminal domain
MRATFVFMVKPARLRPGDTVAAISLSSGFPALMPHRYAAGKRQIEEAFGVKVIETPNAMRDPDWLYRNPKARADDLHWALRNDAVRAIFSTIGGYESVRILPHLDHELIGKHPKIMMGSSDTTVTLTRICVPESSHSTGRRLCAIWRKIAASGRLSPSLSAPHCSRHSRFNFGQRRTGPRNLSNGATRRRNHASGSSW